MLAHLSTPSILSQLAPPPPVALHHLLAPGPSAVSIESALFSKQHTTYEEIPKNPNSHPSNQLQQALQQERRLRQTGLIVGFSFAAVASIFGSLFGFFDPTAILLLFGVIVITAGTITESYNEYRSPLPESSFLVQESTIPNAGMGLFATSFIPENTYLFDYEGEILTEDEYFYRYPDGTGRYVAQIDQGFYGEPIYIDGIDPSKSNLARYINSLDGDDANLVWRKQRFGKQGGSMHFYAIRDLMEGEEAFFDYGNNYWEIANEIDYQV
jgi:hypothetical protein